MLASLALRRDRQPQLVTDAIKQVVDKVRADSKAE
jgi:hypothetical protein